MTYQAVIGWTRRLRPQQFTRPVAGDMFNICPQVN
jgi:hypothetical protein